MILCSSLSIFNCYHLLCPLLTLFLSVYLLTVNTFCQQFLLSGPLCLSSNCYHFLTKVLTVCSFLSIFNCYHFLSSVLALCSTLSAFTLLPFSFYISDSLFLPVNFPDYLFLSVFFPTVTTFFLQFWLAVLSFYTSDSLFFSVYLILLPLSFYNFNSVPFCLPSNCYHLISTILTLFLSVYFQLLPLSFYNIVRLSIFFCIFSYYYHFLSKLLTLCSTLSILQLLSLYVYSIILTLFSTLSVNFQLLPLSPFELIWGSLGFYG